MKLNHYQPSARPQHAMNLSQPGTGAGKIAHAEGNCDAIQGIFTGFTDYAKLIAKGNFILPFCTTPDAIGDKGAELAGNLAKAITG